MSMPDIFLFPLAAATFLLLGSSACSLPGPSGDQLQKPLSSRANDSELSISLLLREYPSGMGGMPRHGKSIYINSEGDCQRAIETDSNVVLQFGEANHLAPDFFKDFELEPLLRELEQQRENIEPDSTDNISEFLDSHLEIFIASTGESVLYWYGSPESIPGSFVKLVDSTRRIAKSIAMAKPDPGVSFVRALALDERLVSEIESAGLFTELNGASTVSNSVIGYGLKNPFRLLLVPPGRNPLEGFSKGYVPGRSLLMLRTDSNSFQIRTYSTE